MNIHSFIFLFSKTHPFSIFFRDIYRDYTFNSRKVNQEMLLS